MPTLPPALHLGTLHPVEQLLVLLLAVGPFLVLGLVVRHQRRDASPDAGDEASGAHEEARDDAQR